MLNLRDTRQLILGFHTRQREHTWEGPARIKRTDVPVMVFVPGQTQPEHSVGKLILWWGLCTGAKMPYTLLQKRKVLWYTTNGTVYNLLCIRRMQPLKWMTSVHDLRVNSTLDYHADCLNVQEIYHWLLCCILSLLNQTDIRPLEICASTLWWKHTGALARAKNKKNFSKPLCHMLQCREKNNIYML